MLAEASSSSIASDPSMGSQGSPRGVVSLARREAGAFCG
jgi:hypothetical protein